MSRNVRVSSRKDRSASELARTPEGPAKAARPPVRQTRQEREVVKDRIQRLECYIASADARARHHNAAYADYIPPAEETRRSTAARNNNGRRPMHTEALARRRSAALFMQVIMLFVVIAATAGWMNQRFHFWN